MRIGAHIVKLDALCSCSKHSLFRKSFNHRLPLLKGKTVRFDGMGRGSHLLDEALVAWRGDDRGSVGNEAPNTTGMIVVVMRGNQVSNWLAGHCFLDFGDHRLRALFAQRSIDEQHVIVESDKQAIV